MTPYEQTLLATSKKHMPTTWGAVATGRAALLLNEGKTWEQVLPIIEQEAVTHAHKILQAALHEGLIRIAD